MLHFFFDLHVHFSFDLILMAVRTDTRSVGGSLPVPIQMPVPLLHSLLDLHRNSSILRSLPEELRQLRNRSAL